MSQAVATSDNNSFTRDPIEYFFKIDTELVEYIEKIVPGYTDQHLQALKERRIDDPSALLSSKEFAESFGCFMKVARNCKTITDTRVPYDVSKQMVRRLYGWFFHPILEAETHLRLARKVPRTYRAKTYSKVRFNKGVKHVSVELS